MKTLSLILRNSVFQWVLALWCLIALALYLIVSVYSTRPSANAERYWAELYAGVLPAGYSDFRAHWRHQDIGVHIFSFRRPKGMQAGEVLDFLADHADGFRLHERSPNEIAMRRPNTNWEPEGFEEFRFLSMPETGRIYGMHAHLDSEKDAHPALVKQLHKIANETTP